ncbi:3-hydroxyisobutyrate dehydrogenase [Planomonospora parontospora subsp. parontospora]|uniref:3-hydroxyisobutyrate dehydrogenase n=3 Tax=Planomonospora parontospora TaxID=58119 RepID=A0AA37F6B1_9ACTN|nr:NAD(P)-binding domain-containing protein [Planomonospora parontospora]GGK83353.1 3-hydroxyisobutyrate dehydrogenase [Planomonospora parontospora]GII10451.1 3-hydroxyisobutyrate dehydrogenase [Planomonospora parontospora subsp. parontospora]
MHMNSERPAVTVLGLGMMGAALAGAFLAGGHPTTVWNRSAGRGDDLVAQGAVRAAAVGDAVAAGQVVVVCVRDYDAVREVLEPVRAALAGRVVVNLTSGTSQEARDLAGWAAGHGIGYLDGAIMMTPQGIGTSEAVILYGGEQELFDESRPVLERLGGGATYLGPDTGIPALYDVALLDIMWSTLNGFLHAAALVGTEKIPATAFVPFATGWLGGVASFLPPMAEQIDAGEYAAHDATLETHLSPLGHLIHESRIRGVDADAPGRTRAMVERAIDDGHAADGYARLIEQMRER